MALARGALSGWRRLTPVPREVENARLKKPAAERGVEMEVTKEIAGRCGARASSRQVGTIFVLG